MSIKAVVKGFYDLTVLASNVAELRAFYASLGFIQVVDQGDELAVFLVGTHELAIHTADAQPKSAFVLSLLVSDLQPVVHAAAALGIAVDGPRPLRPGMVGVAIQDPNGNKLEFLEPEKA